jgi:UrcA family protein
MTVSSNFVDFIQYDSACVSYWNNCRRVTKLARQYNHHTLDALSPLFDHLSSIFLLYWRFEMKKLLVTSFFLSLYAVSAPAVLASEEITTSKVSYSDLNLATEAGQSTLNRRLARAVDDVCGSSYSNDLSEVRHVAKCRREAWRGTRTQVALAVMSAKRRLASRDDTNIQQVRVEMRR